MGDCGSAVDGVTATCKVLKGCCGNDRLSNAGSKVVGDNVVTVAAGTAAMATISAQARWSLLMATRMSAAPSDSFEQKEQSLDS